MSAARTVTKSALESAVAKRIAAIAVACAGRARAEGREELAKLWDFFTVTAIGSMPTGSDDDGKEEPMIEDVAVIRAADMYVRFQTPGNRAALKAAVLARRAAVRARESVS